MQLIVEPNTTLDIDRINMATVQNIQNKIEIEKSLNIEDLNKATCNGNKEKEIVEVNIIADDEEKQVNKEIEQAVINIPMSIDDKEAELSNVDLSQVISEQNSLEVKDAQTDESQNLSLEKEFNNLDSAENEVISKSKEMLEEEDYLEDDIISISAEPFSIISESLKENENGTYVLKESLDIIEEKKETDVQIENDESDNDVEFIENDDVLEPVTENENPKSPGLEKEMLQLPIEEEKDNIEITEESYKSLVENDKEIESTIEEENDDIEVIEEAVNTGVHSEPEQILEDKQKDQDDIEIIEPEIVQSSKAIAAELESESISREDKLEVESKSENKSSISCENKSDVSMETTEETDIDLTKEVEIDEEKKDETQIIEEAKEIAVEYENGTDLLIQEGKKKAQEPATDEALETIVSCENESDSKPEEKDKIEILDDKDIPPVHDADKTDLPFEVRESTEDDKSKGDTKDSTEVSKCMPDVVIEASKIDLVDAPILPNDNIMDIDEILEEPEGDTQAVDSPIELKDDMDVEEIVEKNTTEIVTAEVIETNPTPVNNVLEQPVVCKLSNTLDILSDDDEDEPSKAESPKAEPPAVDPPKIADANKKQFIDLDDDDDIMLISDETANKAEASPPDTNNQEEVAKVQSEVNIESETGEATVQESIDLQKENAEEEPTPQLPEVTDPALDINISEKSPETQIKTPEPPTQLLPDNFVKTAKKKLGDMTRDELEEFCILKIVESIVDRSSLGEIKSKIKYMTQGLDEYRKKIMMLTKQNRDLQVVLKSVQEEQKKIPKNTILPLKITRSVGMQVFMEKSCAKRKAPQQTTIHRIVNNPQPRNGNPQGPRPQRANQPIPVPRLVPANSPVMKSPITVTQIIPMNSNKNNPQNGIVKNSPNTKAEKRPFNKVGSSNVTVDLTDDEPPAKLPGGPKTSPAPPVRVVPPQNLMGPQRQPFGPGVNSPRKVYIPISGPQNQALRPGQTIMLKTVPAPGMRPRTPQVAPNSVRITRVAARHPAPLPLAMKQYQPPNWKALPPAPDLKLSKVENGIVISWKIEGIPEDSYEEIASYQLYAYQETATPPSTSLWKKIGDVKALPLPMACTLTQFMAGYKYYFAVRAVDVKSRIGPFSLPGSILLLSKSI